MKIIKKITMQKLILLGLFLSCSTMQNVLAFCEGMGPNLSIWLLIKVIQTYLCKCINEREDEKNPEDMKSNTPRLWLRSKDNMMFDLS